jgi:hypothetical protein
VPHLATNVGLDPKLQECVDNCTECHAICVATAQHCLELGGEHAAPHHIRTLLDCAQICQTSADFMLRQSAHHPAVCRCCAELCRACEEECRRMAGGDELMRRCAEACARCAESCDRMARAA